MSSTQEVSSEKKVRAIVLDAGGVVISDVAKPYPPSDEDKEAIWSELWSEWKVTEDLDEAWFWSQFISRCPNFERDIHVSVSELQESVRQGFFQYDQTLKVVHTLKERGYAVGICSNHVKEWFDYTDERFQLRTIFPADLVVVSCEAKYGKPSSEIFAEVIARTQKYFEEAGDSIRADQIVFVDNKLANVSAASKAGLNAIHFYAEEESEGDLIRKLTEAG
eukprot:CAMPEP_0174241242 /NCGR_PEP_ID=MMETSP0417-20130205/22368_1 /TAXON_ID=242541 /ORGANISM="Mayorella sp, Strain BSH-02190019" /LENGTH=220 /DNA_ID=CAMNT_0015320451 /DNA_START=44 /DNA_END=703 /DNA_ORIENTATION=-